MMFKLCQRNRGGMDAIEASEWAASIEFRLGAGAEEGRIECFAVPQGKGSSRRRSSWMFLLVTDLPDVDVRDGLEACHVETIHRRGSSKSYAVWPPES